MADLYMPHLWRDRISEYPTRRRLVQPETGQEWLVDIRRAEGAVHTEGDWLDAEALNKLETRLQDAFAGAGGALAEHASLLATQGAGLAETSGKLAAHAADEENPHGVTPGQIGAAESTALAAHVADADNPHGVTPAAIGAAKEAVLNAHMEDGENPHGVNLEQIGAASEQAFTLHKTAMNNATAALNQAVEGLEEAVVAHAGTLAGHGDALAANGTKLAEHSDALAASSARLAEHGTAIAGHGETLRTQEAALTVVADQLGGMDGRLSTIDGQLNSLDGQLSTLGGRVTTVDGRLTSLGGEVSSEVARLEALIAQSGGSEEVWVNVAPGNAKFYAGAPIGHLYRILSISVTFSTENSLLDGWDGCLVLNGNNQYSVAVPTTITGLQPGQSFELEFAGTATSSTEKTAEISLAAENGTLLSNSAAFAINDVPSRQGATLTATAAHSGTVYLLYHCVEGLGFRGAERIYTLRLLRQAAMPPEGPPLGANLYDPMGVENDAFDAGNHKLVGYQPASGKQAVAGGDSVLAAIAKLEARLALLGG